MDNINMKIYLDYAATGPITPRSKAKMMQVFDAWATGDYANAGGLYQSANNSSVYLEQMRNCIKDITGAEFVIFTSCASEANSMVINYARKVITTKYEHPSVKHNPKAIIVAPEEVEQELAKEPCMLSISGIQHETGLMRDIPQLYKLCKKYHCKLHVDAAQMKEFCLEHADFLTISSHKLGGPIGIAALISNEQIKPIIFGGQQEENMRAGTQALPLIAGFVEAIIEPKPAFKSLKNIIKAMVKSEYLLETYAPNEKWCDYIMCLISPFPASEIAAFMDLNGICIAIGSACTSGALEEMSMLERFSNIPKSMRNGIRISFGSLTTEDDVVTFCNKFNEFLQKRSTLA